MLKLLIGGSPCTYWSVAQKKGREVEAEGFGWELFKNYLLAKEKFKPDFFLYENNKSAATPIKAQISRELNVDLMPTAESEGNGENQDGGTETRTTVERTAKPLNTDEVTLRLWSVAGFDIY